MSLRLAIDGAYIANVQKVKFGDVMRVYYASGGGHTSLGTFEVLDETGESKRFAATVKRTALHVVTDDQLDLTLRKLGAEPENEGYQDDPVIKKLTGWLLKARPDVTALPFPMQLFPSGFAGSLREIT